MPRCLAGFAATLGFLSVATSSPGAEPMVGGTRYRLTIDNDSQLSEKGAGPETSWGMVAYDYRVAREGARVEIAIDRITRARSRDGQERSRSEQTRSRLVSQASGKVTITDRAAATPQLLTVLDQLEAPLAVLTLDAEGREVVREMKDNGVFGAAFVDLLRPFSPSFPRDKAEWDAKPRFRPSSGQEMHGTLHYVKRPATKPGGPIEVDVSGKLDITGKSGPADIKAGHEEVKGVQVFDPILGDWVASKLTIVSETETMTAAGAPLTVRNLSVMTLTREETPAGAAEKAKEAP